MNEYRSTWDRLGIALSVVCLAHCLLLPLAIVALPLMAVPWLQADTVHVAMALALAPVAVLALIPGLRRHRRWGVAGTMAAGLGLVSTAAFASQGSMVYEWGSAITVAGGAILVMAHFVNLRLCRSCPACVLHNNPQA